jgi:F-type H+-transporting ATPase subunit b
MRIARRLAVLVVLCASACLASEHGESPAADNTTMWKWVNFGILAAALTLVAVRVGGPALRAQKEQIQRELTEAQRARAEADLRVAEIEKRLGNLDGEIEAFRRESSQRAELEGARIRQETSAMVEAIEERARLEMESLAGAARASLRREVASLAVSLAQKQLAAGLPQEQQVELVSGFLADLEKVAA